MGDLRTVIRGAKVETIIELTRKWQTQKRERNFWVEIIQRIVSRVSLPQTGPIRNLFSFGILTYAWRGRFNNALINFENREKARLSMEVARESETTILIRRRRANRREFNRFIAVSSSSSCWRRRPLPKDRTTARKYFCPFPDRNPCGV